MKLRDACKGFAYTLLSVTGLLLLSGCGTTGSVTPATTNSQCARGEVEVPQKTRQAEAGVAKTQAGIAVEKEKESDSKAHEKLDAVSRIEEALKMIATGPLAGAYIGTAGGHLPTYPGLVRS
jgi:hypothetical protein